MELLEFLVEMIAESLPPALRFGFEALGFLWECVEWVGDIIVEAWDRRRKKE
jgi:hypothetical protein